MPPRHRPPWWPDEEPWPPQRWPPGRGGPHRHGPAWGIGWGRGGAGIGLAVRLVLRAYAMVLLVIVFVGFLAWIGVAVTGIASAPIGAVALTVLLLVVVAVALWAVIRSFRRAGRPLDRLVEAAGRVEAGDYSVRVPEDGPPDLRSLERAFNGMSARLEAGDRTRRTFLADVSHELRTPLTVMRGQLEAIADGVYPADPEHLAPVLAQTAALERLVDDLRTVALAESGALPLHREPVELAVLAAAVAADFGAAARDAGVTLRAASVELAPISADPALLRRVLGNLVANALRHTPAGGSVRLEVGSAPDGRQRLAVADTGTGIPPELLPRIFDRFAKGPASDGTGLGLAIAKDLVEAHGGTIRAEAPPGGGTRMVVELPG